MKISLVGVGHDIQCGIYANEKVEQYRDLVKRICKEQQIRNIVEEMNQFGLEKRGVSQTVAKEIASNLELVSHSYIEVPEEIQTSIGINQGNIAQLSMDYDETAFNCGPIRDLLTRILVDPIRERYWLIEVLKQNISPTLMICGADHLANLQDLINLCGYGPVISISEIRENRR